ncbi:HEXXH motif-containing putative peptide modification protein [Methylopila sp. M107]|uniref:aKG-HExxH-type peptide beta-hydroxylase n=1 Tax=Methylopila sp. M107 TaxID=1101190 RepID=UPI00036ED136|nr:HEXXH motif-containing putative peptide modification protein [Methylopila sp. M107]
MTDPMTGRRSALFEPDPARIARLDAEWRRRLSQSLAYVGETLAARGQDFQADIGLATAALDAGPASPWITGLYSRLVSEVATNDSGVAKTVADLVEAANLPARSARAIVLDDASVPARWWTQYRRLIDTDEKRRFRPRPPSPEDAEATIRVLDDGMEVLRRADPAFHDEVGALARVVVLGVPESDARSDGFGACSTFFMRETVLVNAAAPRSAVDAVDVLVHETSHILLFSLAMNQALTTDGGEARFASAARSDPRPIDGIFHAAFVSTRVHLALTRMIASARLTETEAADAERQLTRNERVATQTLETVVRHGAPTAVGQGILDALTLYWDVPGRTADAA